MRIQFAVAMVLFVAACGSEGPPENEREISQFYETVDFAGLKAEFESRFPNPSLAGSRTGNGGKGIGFDGWWLQDFRFRGKLGEGDDGARLVNDVATRIKAISKSAGAIVQESTTETLPEGGSVLRLPYRHDRNLGEWMVSLGPGEAEGEQLLIVTMREKQPTK